MSKFSISRNNGQLRHCEQKQFTLRDQTDIREYRSAQTLKPFRIEELNPFLKLTG